MSNNMLKKYKKIQTNIYKHIKKFTYYFIIFKNKNKKVQYNTKANSIQITILLLLSLFRLLLN